METLFPASFAQSRHFKKFICPEGPPFPNSHKALCVLAMTLGLEILRKSQWNFRYSCLCGSITLRLEE